MNEQRRFEKYQDFLNKKYSKKLKQNINKLKRENITEPSFNINNKLSKNVTPSYITKIKRQINLKKINDDKIQITMSDIQEKNNKEDSINLKRTFANKKNYINNNFYKEEKKDDKKNKSNKKKYSEKLYNSDISDKKSINKIYKYPINNFIENKKNIRHNISLDSIPSNKELNHILSSYDFKNDNELGDLNIKTKIHFKNLLTLVYELKAKNELLKKELRNRDDLISSYEKMNLNKSKNEKDEDNKNDLINNKFDREVLLDNQKLKAEILKLNKDLELQKINYDDIVYDFNNQLNESKNENNFLENKYKEIEKKYIDSNEKILNMEKDLENAILRAKNLEDINQKYEIISTNQQKRIEFLENHIKVILTLIKELFNKEKDTLYPMRSKLFYDISKLNNIYQ